jgi:hypothetical protein
LIDVSHSGENITDRIASVVEEFGLIDKVFSVSLDNASANSRAFEILQPMFFGYLGSILHLQMMILTRCSICLCINAVYAI